MKARVVKLRYPKCKANDEAAAISKVDMIATAYKLCIF